MRPSPAALVRVVLILLATLLAPLGSAAFANAPDDALPLGKRVALVIGNGSYGELGTLPNPPNDASDIAAALRELHFEVTLVTDGDVDEMRRALRDFGDAATGASVALFFYAGHGMQMNGENYLVPVHARIENQLDLRYETLGLTDVRDTLDFTNAQLKMVILDACRDNPLAKLLQRNAAQLGRGLQSGEGLARMSAGQASGMLIVYATAPGEVALDGSSQRNSPFTKALLAHISDENTDARVMFGNVRADVVEATDKAQTPWTEEAMLGQFQFNPVAVEPAPPTPPDDYAAWQKISKSDDPVDFEDFKTRFPESYLAGAADLKLKQLRDPAAERAAWDTAQASKDPAALEKFLRGYPDGPYSGAARSLLQIGLGARLLTSNDPAAMQAYIDRFPDAPLADVVRAHMEAVRTAAAAAPAAPPAAPTTPPAPPAEMAAVEPGDGEGRALLLANPPMSENPAAAIAPEADLSASSVAALRTQVSDSLIQAALTALDYYHGTIDGKFGPASQRAAAAYQTSLGTSATGDLQPVEIVALIGAAARKGDPIAETTYGGMFMTGAGLARDLPAAVDWYRRAAEANYGYGQMNLGLAYLNGWGVEKDLREARRWLEAAQANDVEQARAPLAGLR